MKEKSRSGKKKALLITLICIVSALAILFGAFLIYTANYYRADDAAIEAFLPNAGINERILDDKTVLLTPENPKAGFIFYPGAKVEYTAYLPLMRALASQGIACALVKMPFNLAVLNSDKADDIFDLLPTVREWYIGGHSLGGSMAASYLSKNSERLKGLVLLAAYSTEDISQSGARVLSLLGSNDGVLNREKYEENKDKLPSGFEEYIIEGGNHAYFGLYGEQKGDGAATITADSQIFTSAREIAAFILGK